MYPVVYAFCQHLIGVSLKRCPDTELISSSNCVSGILFCAAYRVKRSTVNFFRSVQTASDRLHGRFQESGARSHSLAGFAHRLLVESGEPSEWGTRETGKVLESPKHQRKGLGTSPYFSSETGQPQKSASLLKLTSTQTLFPQAMFFALAEDAANRVSTQCWNPKKQKLYSIIHSSYPVFTLYLWKSLSDSDLPELRKIGRWQ